MIPDDSTPYDEGCAAGYSKVSPWVNPYRNGLRKAFRWLTGDERLALITNAEQWDRGFCNGVRNLIVESKGVV